MMVSSLHAQQWQMRRSHTARLAVCILIYLFVSACQAASSSSFQEATFPVDNWEPSVAASQAQGTAVAVAYTGNDEQDAADRQCGGAILVLRYPSATLQTRRNANTATNAPPASNDDTGNVDNKHETVHGLEVYKGEASPYSPTSPLLQSRWLSMPHSVCACTGLISDVDFLLRVLQRNVQLDYYVSESSLDGTPQSRSGLLLLAKHISEAARGRNGRPLGVQVLWVEARTDKPVSLYTLDPSGSPRSWGMATAIGQGGRPVRQALYKCLQEASRPLDAQAALSVALASLQKNEAKDDTTASKDSASVDLKSHAYEAFLVECSGGPVRVRRVKEEVVQNLLQQLQGEPSQAKSS
jgi:20S proteasome alpha/beta subunit